MNEDRTSWPLIPATQGFQLISFWMEDEEGDPERKRDPETYDIIGHLWRETIIAWRIRPEGGCLEPITASHSMEEDAETYLHRTGSGISAILDPTGAVTMQHICVLRHIDEWVKEVREEWGKWRAQNPPPPPPRGKKPGLVLSMLRKS